MKADFSAVPKLDAEIPLRYKFESKLTSSTVAELGRGVGLLLGSTEGSGVGLGVGGREGEGVGAGIGTMVGWGDVGSGDGFSEGCDVGSDVGSDVGASVMSEVKDTPSAR